MNRDDNTLSFDSFRGILDTTYFFRWEKNTVLEISGAEAIDLLHRLSTNDILGVPAGGTVGSCFLTEKGRLVDYVNILLSNGRAFIFPSPGKAGRFAEWIERFIIMEEVTVRDRSDDFAGYSIVGPTSGDVVSRALGVCPVPWHHSGVTIDGETVIVSHRGIPEVDRFDILVPNHCDRNVRTLIDKIPLYDHSVRELLRIWKGIPGYGSEISEHYNPYETGYSAFLNMRKGCYIGQEVIARLATYDKIQKTLAGVLLSNSAMDGESHELYFEKEVIGVLTSTSRVSVGGYFPGLAIIRRNTVEPGYIVSLSREDSLSTAVIAPLPFSLDLLNSLPAIPSGSSSWMAR